MIKAVLLAACFLTYNPAWAADSYFPNIKVLGQPGRTVQFDRDILQGKSVVTHSFFGDCQGACPFLLDKMKQAREPLANTASSLEANPWCYSISGNKVNSGWLHYKPGQSVETGKCHFANFPIGKEPSGKWGKLAVNASVDQIANALDRVSEGTVANSNSTRKPAMNTTTIGAIVLAGGCCPQFPPIAQWAAPGIRSMRT